MMSKEEIEAEANEWIRSQGWSEETLPSDEYIQMVSAYVAGHYAGWNAKADDINEMGLCLQSDMDKTIKQNFELKAEIKRLKELQEENNALREKFTEIFRLKKMLEEANIPFQFSENFNGGFHIVYSFEGKEICSVIEHDFSYGREKDLLEIQGLMTEQEMEEEQDSVLGYLTADNVFERINMHWTSVRGKKQ